MANWETYGVGLNNVGSYLASGIPYLTGSSNIAASGSSTACQDNIKFPSVTRTFTLVNTGDTELRLHFADMKEETVVWQNLHYVALENNGDSVTMSVKCAELYISNAGSSAGSYMLFAELTQVPAERMFVLSGSGINEDNGSR